MWVTKDGPVPSLIEGFTSWGTVYERRPDMCRYAVIEVIDRPDWFHVVDLYAPRMTGAWMAPGLPLHSGPDIDALVMAITMTGDVPSF